MKQLSNQTKTKKLDKIEKIHERELAEAYKQARENIKKEIATLEQKGELNAVDAQTKARLKRLEKEVSKEIQLLNEKTGETLKKEQMELYETAYKETTVAISTGTGRTIAIVIPTRQIERAIKNPLDKVGFINRNIDNQDKLRKQLNQVMTQGLIQGKSYGKIADKIDERFNVGFNNAIRIARTEGQRVREQGSEDARVNAEKLGVILKKMWLTARDDKVRDAHAQLNEVTIDTDEYFEVDGHKTKVPGGFGIAGLDINCRCTIIDIVETKK